MTIELLTSFLGWCTLINFSILLAWFLGFALIHDQIYQLHCRWFKLSVQDFDAIHYRAMAFFKLGIFLLNLTPYLTLKILS